MDEAWWVIEMIHKYATESDLDLNELINRIQQQVTTDMEAANTHIISSASVQGISWSLFSGWFVKPADKPIIWADVVILTNDSCIIIERGGEYAQN